MAAIKMTRAEIFNGDIPVYNFSRDSKALERFHEENSEPFSFMQGGKRRIGRSYKSSVSSKAYIVEHTSGNGGTFYTFNELRCGQVAPFSQYIEIVGNDNIG